MRAEELCNPGNQLGEGPVWSRVEGCLYWVDIRDPAIFQFNGHVINRYPMPAMPGCISMCHSGMVAVALTGGVHLFDTRSKALELLVELEKDLPDNRPNDGRCDPLGRLWLGTMVDRNRYTGGTLYRIDGSESRAIFGDIAIPNSIQFSPNGDTFYFSDTPTGNIWAYGLDLESGTIGERRLLVSGTELPGKPDGSAMDADGCLWNARFGAGYIARITPDGRCDRLVQVPASQVSSCTFGGRDSQTLFITSARQNLNPLQLATEPLSGAVFAVETGITGITENEFAL